MKQLYIDAYKIRKVEQALLDLFGKGLVSGTIHTCVGQEFTGVALACHLKKGDVVVSNHRCHGHYLAIFKDYEGLIAEILGKPHGVNRGFGGSQHIHREGFYSSGIQGGMVPAAAGMAFSSRLGGMGNVVISFIGDGTLGQGVVYETLNLIGKHEAPHLIILENNKYAQSTHQAETLAGSIEGRAVAFGLKFCRGATEHPEELVRIMGEAVDFVRSKKRPVVLEVDTYRLNPHSKGDEQRTASEIADARQRDPLDLFLRNHRDSIAQELLEYDAYIDGVIANAISADDTIKIDVESEERGIYAEVAVDVAGERTTIVREVNAAFHDIMHRDEKAVFLGEDIKDPYGGAFKATRGLSEQHPGRVFNMPISEAGIIGFSLGVAMTNRLTFSEIMFGDFLALAFDQIANHAAKMGTMFGKEIRVPLVIRSPMGGGRGYGATHSQCMEKYFAGIPGIDVFLFHPRINARRFYLCLADAITRPAIVVEHKLIYAQPSSKPPPMGYTLHESTERYPYSRLRADRDADITVISFGGTGLQLESIMDAVTAEEVYLDVFYPLDLRSNKLIEEAAASVVKTGKLLLVEEGTAGASLSDYFLSSIARIVAPVARFVPRLLTAKPMPIAASAYLEKQILPQGKDIEAAIWELFDE